MGSSPAAQGRPGPARVRIRAAREQFRHDGISRIPGDPFSVRAARTAGLVLHSHLADAVRLAQAGGHFHLAVLRDGVPPEPAAPPPRRAPAALHQVLPGLHKEYLHAFSCMTHQSCRSCCVCVLVSPKISSCFDVPAVLWVHSLTCSPLNASIHPSTACDCFLTAMPFKVGVGAGYAAVPGPAAAAVGAPTGLLLRQPHLPGQQPLTAHHLLY